MTVSTLAASRVSDASPEGAFARFESTGDVRLGQGVTIAPSAALRTQVGATCVVGSRTVIQEGVAVYGLGQAKVLGDDQRPYTVWIGQGATLTHRVLIQGPAYIGDHVFIGFRSTIFNARLGANSIVMMHALVQDVEVPPGKLVPSGSVITRQSQADGLPDVSPQDLALVRELLGYGPSPADLNALSAQPASAAAGPNLNERDGLGTMQSQQLSPDVVQRVRQYLAQGLRIGTEHADNRRYRSGVWQTCSPIQASREGEAFAALEACLAEHRGEYVRMFGIDPKAKQRVAPVTIQRPDGKAIAVNGAMPAVSGGASQAYRPAAVASGSLSAEVVQQVRQFISQGYRIGTEHADSRRYRSGVWQTCTPINSNRENEVLAALETCLADHAGEYVRLFGIDPRANQRIAPITIQRPDGKPVGGASVPAGTGFGRSVVQRPAGGSVNLSGDLAQQVRQLISQGYHIGAEHADVRRYRSGVWQTCAPVTSNRESDVLAAVSQCMAAYPNEYVRIFGIDPKAKRRGPEVTVQRPGAAPAAAPSVPVASYSAPQASSPAPASRGGGQGLGQDVVQQVNQFVNQGYRLSLEAADQRRYRSNVWKTCATLEGSRVSDLLAAIDGQLRAHQGEYVRLVAVDPKAKRRAAEVTIQRP
ncbi:MAG: Carbon dioxide concentrating mechanism protein [Cyanobacteriota bacterium]|jgi:carbon dioxide concentrating mechanism protein CcmM